MKPITATQGWLSVEQAASYLGVSRRTMHSALTIKKKGIGNHSLRIKQVGSRILISKKSIDSIEEIFTDEKKILGR